MQFVQVQHYNPGCDAPLIVPVAIVPNTSEDVGDGQIMANGRLPLPWLAEVEAHDGVAVICGGGPSLADDMDVIRGMASRKQAGPATVFGLNAAAGFLAESHVGVDYQIIIDAKEETSALVSIDAAHRLYSSQVHPETAKYADCLFHLANIGITDLLPPERVEQGGFTLIGGGVSVGITALTVAYTLGFRRLHLFGYDSSNRGVSRHAYAQPMNDTMPEMDVLWGGKVYRASMPMKLQADAFFRYAEALQDAGCEITVHGDGLLPAMWNNPPKTEREKYQILWARQDYRDWAPGEAAVEQFLAMKPGGLVLDLGCGTGRAAVKMADAGMDVLCIDFTDNCRDKAALRLPFVQWDLTKPLPVTGEHGFCTDVMEHIPPEDVDAVLANIMASVRWCFFQIATVPDKFGATIGQPLHLTVQDHDWWAAKFRNVLWSERTPMHSSFYVASAKT
jgi:SAM-dependent methyltransferase